VREYRVVWFRGKYAAEWTDGGRRKRASLGTSDRLQIDAALRRLDSRLEAEGRPNILTVEAAWKGKRATLGARPAGVAMAARWKTLGPYFGHLPADGVTEQDCDVYTAARREQGRADGTILAELKQLRAALHWAEKKRLIGRAPYIKAPSCPDPRDVRLTREQAKKFLAACEYPHLRLFALLALMTGARKQAILDLTWDRVDFERRQIELRDPERPEGKTRPIVAMNATARRALEAARRGATTRFVIEWAGHGVGNVKEGLHTVGKRAGLPWVTPHVFRHSAATWMAEAGVPMAEIAQFLGHADSRITERVYARFSPHYLHKPASALDRDISTDTDGCITDTAVANEPSTKRRQMRSDPPAAA
jgi:integrase